MSEAPPVFAVIEATYESKRTGPRLDVFEPAISNVKPGQAFDIPTFENAKKKRIPKFGFNVKAANELYAPKRFKKARVRNAAGEDVLRVYCLAAKPAKPEKK